MAFVNTREVLGERATLDGLISGTLEELKDDCTDDMNATYMIPNNTNLKLLVMPYFGVHTGNQFSSDDYRYETTNEYIPGLETVVTRLIGDPSVTYVFSCCNNLKTADLLFTNNYYLYIGLFGRCHSLTTLIIRNTSFVRLASDVAFAKSSFASDGTGGTLYVPQALIPTYQSATNWSTVLAYENNQILPIEGSIYETNYADGTPIE